MSVTVRIPTPLRTVTDGQSTAQVDGGTVGEVFTALTAAHPALRERILDDGGQVRRFVNVFVDDEDIRFLQGLQTAVPDGGTVSIIPAVAGGQAMSPDVARHRGCGTESAAAAECPPRSGDTA